MLLTTVGTGTAAPVGHRVCSGHHVQAGTVRLLMDCGSGVTHRMAELGMRWQDVTHVALSHFHNDHVSDLSTLIFAWRYGDLPARTAPVEVIGPAGTALLFERLASALGEWVLVPGFPFTIREVAPDDQLDLGDGVTLACRKVPHTDESLAFAVTRGRARLVYTGDTGYDDGLADWAAHCSLLLAECSLPEHMAIDSHLTPERCGRLAARAACRQLALTHLYPPVEREDVHAGVALAYAGHVAIARDGWTIDLEE